MDKKELKKRLKNSDFREGYLVAEELWKSRLSSAVAKERAISEDFKRASVNLYLKYSELNQSK